MAGDRRLARIHRHCTRHLASLGGANYKDTFSLPHTETASVAKVLKNAASTARTARPARSC